MVKYNRKDSVVYTFAERQLSKEILDKVDTETEEFEKSAKSHGTQKHYQELVSSLEQKY